MKYILAILMAFVLASSVSAQELRQLYHGFASLDTRYAVNNEWKSAGRYSGAFLSENETSFLILTCGHGPSPAPFGSTTWVRCFYHGGVASEWMEGYVDWYKAVVGDYSNDIGYVVLPKSEFKRVGYPLPTVAHISNVVPQHGLYTTTLGHPTGSHYPTALSAYITAANRTQFSCIPAVKQGRSGSMFYDDNGSILGMVLATGVNNRTTAVNVTRILELSGEYSLWRRNRLKNN